MKNKSLINLLYLWLHIEKPEKRNLMIFSLLAIETLQNHFLIYLISHFDKNSPVKKRADHRPHFEKVCSHDIHLVVLTEPGSCFSHPPWFFLSTQKNRYHNYDRCLTQNNFQKVLPKREREREIFYWYLPKLLRIELPNSENLFIVSTVGLLLQIHNSRCILHTLINWWIKIKIKFWKIKNWNCQTSLC